MSKCTQDNQNITEKKPQESLRKNIEIFVKGRWFPLIITLIALAVFSLVMAVFGWRITYAPELETSWDAISAVAAWVAAIGAVATVWYALRIANQQNKITLLEKRMECLFLIDICNRLMKILKNSKSDDLRDVCSFIVFGQLKATSIQTKMLTDRINEIKLKFYTMEYIFPEIQEQDLKNIYQSFTDLLIQLLENQIPKPDEEIRKYLAASSAFMERYYERITKHINIF